MNRSLFRKFAPLAVLALMIGAYDYINPLRLEHVFVIILLIVLVVIAQPTRDLAVTLAPMAIFGFSYDAMRVFQTRSFFEVHSASIYHLERFLFGWMTPAAGDLGPVDFFRDHHWFIVDLLAGIWYSTHVPSIIVFGLFLWWRYWRRGGETEDRLDKFFWGYLAFNLIGFVVWAAYPTAPPWYVKIHGFVAPDHLVQGDPAALARVDHWLGYRHFADIYQQSTYVFGAMPSLHVAPSIWIALWTRKTLFKILAWLYAISMCFFAVYLGHHYVLDVFAGGLLASGTYYSLAHTRLGEVPVRLSFTARAYANGLLEPTPQEVLGD